MNSSLEIINFSNISNHSVIFIFSHLISLAFYQLGK